MATNSLSHYASLKDKEEFIMNGDYCIDTEEQLDKLISKYKPTEEPHEENEEASANNTEAMLKTCGQKTPKYIFRGVNEASYRLYTTAQRAYDELKLDIPYSDFIQFYIDKTLKNKEICNYFKGKDYQITDFLILSLLQHYGYPTPLLDFSYDIYSALFFAIDNMKEGNNDEGISDYVSLYIVNSANNMKFPDIFQVAHNDGETAQWLLGMINGPIPEPAPETKQDFDRLPYNNYKNTLILLVSGGDDSATGVRIPERIDVNYYNSNPNLESQHGLFMYNSSYEKALDKRIYEQPGCQKRKDNIVCFNINKNLKNTIVTKYLEPRNINKETVYSDSNESKNIEKWLTDCRMPSMKDIQNNTESAREYLIKNILITKEIILTLRDFLNSDDCPEDFSISTPEDTQNKVTIHIKDMNDNLCFELSAVKMSSSDRDDIANNCGWFIKIFQYYPYLLLNTEIYEAAFQKFENCVKKQSSPQSNGNDVSHTCDPYVWAKFSLSEENPKIVEILGLAPISENQNEANRIYMRKIN